MQKCECPIERNVVFLSFEEHTQDAKETTTVFQVTDICYLMQVISHEGCRSSSWEEYSSWEEKLGSTSTCTHLLAALGLASDLYSESDITMVKKFVLLNFKILNSIRISVKSFAFFQKSKTTTIE